MSVITDRNAKDVRGNASRVRSLEAVNANVANVMQVRTDTVKKLDTRAHETNLLLQQRPTRTAATRTAIAAPTVRGTEIANGARSIVHATKLCRPHTITNQPHLYIKC